MKTLNRIVINAPIQAVYAAAQGVVEWPRLLRHYRWIRIFEDQGGRRLVEMAASRDGFPCKWTSRQRLFPRQHKVYYLHVRSFWTKGMEVWWLLKRIRGGATEVVITHDLPPISNPIRRWFYAQIIGGLFVHDVADKTLAGLKRRLEAGS